MATAFDDRRDRPALAGQCECDGTDKAVSITILSVDGCVLEASEDWLRASDFAHLRIADTITMNGRFDWIQGRRAQMRFFGQIHPAAIAKLVSEASS